MFPAICGPIGEPNFFRTKIWQVYSLGFFTKIRQKLNIEKIGIFVRRMTRGIERCQPLIDTAIFRRDILKKHELKKTRVNVISDRPAKKSSMGPRGPGLGTRFHLAVLNVTRKWRTDLPNLGPFVRN